MNIDASTLNVKLAHFFREYHAIIYFVTIAICLGLAVVTLNNVVSSTDHADGYVSSANNTSLDDTMIQRMRALKSGDESTDKIDFGGRISPF